MNNLEKWSERGTQSLFAIMFRRVKAHFEDKVYAMLPHAT